MTEHCFSSVIGLISCTF